jgi:transcriptional regulator with XRE-family HTH domain
MRSSRLGQEIRRLRLKSDTSLRGLAAKLGISAAHLSDIEHNRRRPSEKLLRAIARGLRHSGATFEDLENLVTGVDPDTRDWIASTPGIRRVLRRLQEWDASTDDVLRALEKAIGRKRTLSRQRR